VFTFHNFRFEVLRKHAQPDRIAENYAGRRTDAKAASG